MKKAAHAALLRLPPTPALDRLQSLALFYTAHHRCPRRGSGLFNDYLYFLKTRFEDDPVRELRRQVSDKEEAKAFAQDVLGNDIAPRTLALYDRPAQLQDGVHLPACVVKPTHLGGGKYLMYHETGPLTVEEIGVIRRWFDVDLFRNLSREPNYRGVKHRVIAEELVADASSIVDYKFFCYQGEPKAIQVDIDRHSAHRRRLYTVDWTPLDYGYNKPLAEPTAQPARLETMLAVARALSAKFDFVRVDLYETPDRIWFGELTNCPENAHGRFRPAEAERSFSRLIFG